MDIKPVRRSSLFLMELILAIFFFILASAICVRFFVKAHTLEQESMDLNHAVTAAASVAEIVRSEEEPFAFLEKHFPQGEAGNEVFTIFYDSNRSLCDKADAKYTLVLDGRTTDTIFTGEIVVSKGNTEIYRLTAESYIREEGALR